MFSPKRRLPSAPSTRKRSFRPRLEELENRLAPAGLLTLTIPKTIVPTQPPSGGPASAGPALTSFSAASGALSITGSGAAVQVAATADGGLNVTVNGQLLSSDPSSPNYYPALAGAVESAVHNITLTGGGSVDALTLDNLSGSNLTIQSDGYATLGAVAESGQLTATAPRMTIDGAVSAAVLSLNSPGLLFVEGDGSLAAPSITVTADSYVSTGQVRADGAQGGAVSVTAVDYLNAGVVSASGSAGAGGSVTVNFTDSYIDVQAAVTAAAGVGGAGGQISIDGGTTGRLFSSGTFTATGTTGGDIDLFGNSIALIAATADADGSAGAGGRIRVGGDYQGNNPAVPNAQTVVVSNAATLSADAGGMGAGGRIIVWSQSTTTFAGTLSAQPAGGAAGGFLEVS
ncbi:MAG TPA: hypothetical protein VMS17_28625, partial [Gemmataceae bacterium]|nr:hypothetical protein [Gemmataceae bacterium]